MHNPGGVEWLIAAERQAQHGCAGSEAGRDQSMSGMRDEEICLWQHQFVRCETRDYRRGASRHGLRCNAAPGGDQRFDVERGQGITQSLQKRVLGSGLALQAGAEARHSKLQIARGECMALRAVHEFTGAIFIAVGSAEQPRRRRWLVGPICPRRSVEFEFFNRTGSIL